MPTDWLNGLVDVLRLTGRALITAEPQGYLVLAVIGALFLRGLAGLRRAGTAVARCWDQLEVHRGALQRWAISSSNDSEAHEEADDATEADPTVASETFDAHVQRVHPSDYPGRVLGMVYRHRRLATPNVASILAAVRAHEWTELERQRRTPNLLMLIGLAGTVLGLAAALARIDVTALAAGRTALDTFEAVLKQLPTAFLTTIWGIVGAVVFSGLLGRFEARASAFVSELERVASAEWVPAMWPAGLPVQYEDLRKSMQSTHRVLNKTRKMMESMTVSFAETLTSTSDAMGKHVTDLTVVSSETREAFQQMSGEVARTVGALDRGSQEMRSAIERLQAFHGEMQNAYSRMDDLFREAQAEAKQQVMGTLDATRAQQTQFGEATDRTMTALNAVSRHLTALADRLDAQSERLEGVRDTMLAAVSDGFRQTGARFAGELGPAIQLLGAAAGKLEAPVSTFQGLVERTVVGSEATAALQRVETLAASLAGDVQRLDATLERLLGDGAVAQALARVEAAMDRMPQPSANDQPATHGGDGAPRPESFARRVFGPFGFGDGRGQGRGEREGGDG
jgi:hypothetical protein